MIESEAQLKQTLELIESLKKAVESVRARYMPSNSRMYELLSTGALEHIAAMEAEIAEYKGKKINADPQ